MTDDTRCVFDAVQPPQSSECFSAVRQVREAALDAQLLVVATDLAKEKATQMCSGNDFDPNIFAEQLVSEYTVHALSVHVFVSSVHQRWRIKEVRLTIFYKKNRI